MHVFSAATGDSLVIRYNSYIRIFSYRCFGISDTNSLKGLILAFAHFEILLTII